MIIDHPRNIKELYQLYCDRPMPSQYPFRWLVNNPHLYCFYSEGVKDGVNEGVNEGKLLGFITVQKEHGELTLSGTSIPKNMPNIITAIITVCKAFNEDIVSYTPLKHAALVLRKAGFEKVGKNKYIRRCKNG